MDNNSQINLKDRELYIALYSKTPVTFAIGIYETEEKANNAIIEFIFKYENEQIVEFMKDENIKTKKKLIELFQDEGYDTFDFLYSVEDRWFDYSNYSDWDSVNLKDMLENIEAGTTATDLKLSSKTKNILKIS